MHIQLEKYITWPFILICIINLSPLKTQVVNRFSSYLKQSNFLYDRDLLTIAWTVDTNNRNKIIAIISQRFPTQNKEEIFNMHTDHIRDPFKLTDDWGKKEGQLDQMKHGSH